ncbi:MAG: FHA domain-containing protein [Caldilineae bacterium]|nr:MAG: FHA domain-containing protein [Caldilineae bacterium]
MTPDQSDATILHSSRPAARFIVKQGPQIGIFFPITSDRLMIGREEACNIIIQDPEVSRRHCELAWKEGDFVLQDLGSTNGTFVNGVQITEPVKLKPGDNVGIGQTMMVLELETEGGAGAVGYERPAAAGMPGGTAPLGEGRGSDTRRWILIGCGCLLLLCICAAAVAGILWATDFITLPDVLNLGGV